MTIKEYSQSRGISYEAAAKQVRKYKRKELKKHISYVGSLTMLDDYAIEFLDGHRQPKTVIVNPTNDQLNNAIETLQEENKRLRDKVIDLQDQLLNAMRENQESVLRICAIENSYKPTILGLYRKVRQQDTMTATSAGTLPSGDNPQADTEKIS